MILKFSKSMKSGTYMTRLMYPATHAPESVEPEVYVEWKRTATEF